MVRENRTTAANTAAAHFNKYRNKYREEVISMIDDIKAQLPGLKTMLKEAGESL